MRNNSHTAVEIHLILAPATASVPTYEQTRLLVCPQVDRQCDISILHLKSINYPAIYQNLITKKADREKFKWLECGRTERVRECRSSRDADFVSGSVLILLCRQAKWDELENLKENRDRESLGLFRDYSHLGVIFHGTRYIEPANGRLFGGIWALHSLREWRFS